MTKYNDIMATQICNRLSEGESLRAICKDQGMPSKATVMRWARDKDDFRDQYARAREIGLEMLADEILEIADTPYIGVETEDSENGTKTRRRDMVEHRRLQIDARKWILSKLLPKKYGEASLLKIASEEGPAPSLSIDTNDPVEAARIYAEIMGRDR